MEGDPLTLLFAKAILSKSGYMRNPTQKQDIPFLNIPLIIDYSGPISATFSRGISASDSGAFGATLLKRYFS